VEGTCRAQLDITDDQRDSSLSICIMERPLHLYQLGAASGTCWPACSIIGCGCQGLRPAVAAAQHHSNVCTAFTWSLAVCLALAPARHGVASRCMCSMEAAAQVVVAAQPVPSLSMAFQVLLAGPTAQRACAGGQRTLYSSFLLWSSARCRCGMEQQQQQQQRAIRLCTGTGAACRHCHGSGTVPAHRTTVKRQCRHPAQGSATTQRHHTVQPYRAAPSRTVGRSVTATSRRSSSGAARAYLASTAHLGTTRTTRHHPRRHADTQTRLPTCTTSAHHTHSTRHASI
jgi:hypothetical protein